MVSERFEASRVTFKSIPILYHLSDTLYYHSIKLLLYELVSKKNSDFPTSFARNDRYQNAGDLWWFWHAQSPDLVCLPTDFKFYDRTPPQSRPSDRQSARRCSYPRGFQQIWKLNLWSKRSPEHSSKPTSSSWMTQAYSFLSFHKICFCGLSEHSEPLNRRKSTRQSFSCDNRAALSITIQHAFLDSTYQYT